MLLLYCVYQEFSILAVIVCLTLVAHFCPVCRTRGTCTTVVNIDQALGLALIDLSVILLLYCYKKCYIAVKRKDKGMGVDYALAIDI